jgi:hypothetical protein
MGKDVDTEHRIRETVVVFGREPCLPVIMQKGGRKVQPNETAKDIKWSATAKCERIIFLFSQLHIKRSLGRNLLAHTIRAYTDTEGVG